MPHTMPSMVSRLRVTLRFSATQASRMISSNIWFSVSSFEFQVSSFLCVELLSRCLFNLKHETRNLKLELILPLHSAGPQSDRSRRRGARGTGRRLLQSLLANLLRSGQNSSCGLGLRRSPASAEDLPG